LPTAGSAKSVSQMSDEELSPAEALAKRHRKEKKDMQGKVQNLKKTASKGDKKKKKEVTEEIARLEEELKTRHEKELKELEGQAPSDQVEEATDKLDNVALDEDTSPPGQQKLSKAEKRRLKKEQDDLKREEEIRAAEEQNRYGPRNVETQSIKEQLKQRQLALHEVPSNGDCMFAAILHQASVCPTLPELRQSTAAELRRNKGDYLPFLTSPSGDLMTDDEFETYCDKMATEKTAWGSQVELRAVSQAHNLRIEVVQGEGPVVVIGEDKTPPVVVVTFHKHYFGLGEHYNSTRSLKEDEE